MIRTRTRQLLPGSLLAASAFATATLLPAQDRRVPVAPGAPSHALPPGPIGKPGVSAANGDPLPSLVAVTLTRPNRQAFGSIPALLRMRIEQYARGTLASHVVFPLPNTTDDMVRTLEELKHNVVVSWLDPLTTDAAPNAPRFGANCDYTAYFGAGWDEDWTGGEVRSAPQWNGSSWLGSIWVNHEYISNSAPTTTSAPTGQFLTFAKYLRAVGLLSNDVFAPIWKQAEVDLFDHSTKREFGGSWMTVWQNPFSNTWHLILDEGNVRYDATGLTQLRMTGYRTKDTDHFEDGSDLRRDVVAGLLGDCSGCQTPWGTVITAEENVQDYYGDLETAWNSSNKLITNAGFDAGADIRPDVAPSRSGDLGRITNVKARHSRDVYGFLAEVDPGLRPWQYYVGVQEEGDGAGHRKLGYFGRARWENATIVTDGAWKLVPGKPVVMYASDDRRSGRIYKFVSRESFATGMTKGQVRALLDAGDLYVAHFAGLDNTTGITMLATGNPPTEADPGRGQWLHLSVASADVAPNATALGAPGTTVGDALRHRSYNRIGGFPTDNEVRMALFTATNKIGVMELNRPEDLEWNPTDPSGTPRIYVAFTNFNGQVALDQHGVVFDPDQHATLAPRRADATGSIFAMQEATPGDPGSSKSFAYFLVWRGARGTGPLDAACPDNLMIDKDGGVWFGTDGNFGVNRTADALYYLDLDRSRREGAAGIVTPTWGQGFRLVAGPSDCEATGPALTPDQNTLFFNVQHPGEDFLRNPSTWPPRR